MLKEPSSAALGGGSPLRVAKRLFFATRPIFLTASVLPVLLGTAQGYRTIGRLDGVVLVLALAAIICVHAAGNVFNDVYDDLSGTDRINQNRIFPFTGGSRFIQNGVMSLRQMVYWGLVLLGLGGAFGTVLLVIKGAGLLLFALAGIVLFALYLVPPVHVSSRGLGEAAVAVGFGVFPVTTAAWLQAEAVCTGTVLLSLPVAMWIANVLLINEVPDAEADGRSGKRTLVVILGCDKVRTLYLILNGLAVIAVVAAAVGGVLAPAAVAGPAVLFLAAISAAQTIHENADLRPALTRGIKTTLAIHAGGTLWLTTWALAG